MSTPDEISQRLERAQQAAREDEESLRRVLAARRAKRRRERLARDTQRDVALYQRQLAPKPKPVSVYKPPFCVRHPFLFVLVPFVAVWLAVAALLSWLAH